MDTTRLRRLILAGETATVEFKLECHAFAGNDADKAELAKDICAMANNGTRRSFIIVGVSNDRQRYLARRSGRSIFAQRGPVLLRRCCAGRHPKR